MITLLIALGSFILYIVAYNTYGKFLGKKIFQLDAKNEVPSITQRDGIDYVPTKKTSSLVITLLRLREQDQSLARHSPLFGGGSQHSYGLFSDQF